MLRVKKHFLPPQVQTTAQIPLIGGGFAVVSLCDFHWLNRYAWRLFTGKPKNYAYRRYTVDDKTFTVKMHREIHFAIKGDEVHHIDGNGLNNTRENLIDLSPIEHRLKHGKSR